MKSSIITLLLCIVAFSNCDPPQAQIDPPEFISECNEFRHGLANPETTPAGIQYSLRKLRQLGCYIPATASATPPAPLTGPGVCPVYLGKLASLPSVPNRRNVPTPDEYNFYYNVLSTNACEPLPPTYPCCNIQPDFYDSKACATARKDIYSLVAGGPGYRALDLYMRKLQCKYLPLSIEDYDNGVQEQCNHAFEITKKYDRNTIIYFHYYHTLKKLGCVPLPAPALLVARPSQ